MLTPPPSNDPNALWAFLNGSWIDSNDLAVSAGDIGFRQSAIAVERLRTYHGRVFELDAHLNRWQRTTAALFLENLPSQPQISRTLAELLDRNSGWIQQHGDVGLTIFATPGDATQAVKADQRQPTFAMHLNALDHDRIATRQRQGQPMVVTDIVQPPAESWSRQIKVRCRLHYYLADRSADQLHPGAAGLLVDSDGSITETSVCNVAMVNQDKITSPPDDRILGGITQAVTEKMAERLAIPWIKRPIAPDELLAASEVLMMGTDTGIWFAGRIGDVILGDGGLGPVCKRLQTAFAEFTRQKT